MRGGGQAGRALDAVGHPSVAGVLAATLALGVAWLAWRGLGGAGLAEAWVVRGWSVALAVSLLAGLLSAGLARRPAGALAALGLMLLLAHGWRTALLGFRGTLELGVGERAQGWASVAEGRPIAPPDLAFDAAPGAPDGPFLVTVAGRQVELARGAPLELPGGFALRINGWESAPLLVVHKEAGELEDQVLVKLHPGVQPPEHVELGELPHRFYLSAPARAGPVIGAPEVPARLHLRIQRGKLTVRRLEVQKELGIRFDDRIFAYRDGASWITVEVTRRASLWLAWAGATALAAAGAWLAVARRRS